jgi:hypothetical protein
MSYSDFERKIAKPNGFALYLPPDASEARRIAQCKYEDAIIALASSEDEAHLTALAEVERARRNYGAVLLREDKQHRPHIYAK